MLELSAAEFKRGVFTLTLEEKLPRWRSWATKLGPVKGRVIALGALLFALYMTLNQNLARFLYDSSYFESLARAREFQSNLSWGLMMLAIAFYIYVGVFRREKMLLIFDPGKSQLRFFHSRRLMYSGEVEGLVPFREIEGIRVAGPQREPRTPYGYIELNLSPKLKKAYRKLRFEILSEDQLKIYPMNLYRITECEPQGDWSEPDDLPQADNPL